MSKIDEIRSRKSKLHEKIARIHRQKKAVIDSVQNFVKKVQRKEITVAEYKETINFVYGSRGSSGWVDYYDKQIKYYTSLLNDCNRKLKLAGFSQFFAKTFFVGAILAVLILPFLFSDSLYGTITGFVSFEGTNNKTNESIEYNGSLEDTNISFDDKSTDDVFEFSKVDLNFNEIVELFDFNTELSFAEGFSISIDGPQKVLLSLPKEIEFFDSKRVKAYSVNDKDFLNDFKLIDSDDNRKYDSVEISLLKDDTIIIIIEITEAEHLDSDRGFISDIFDEVYSLDGVWSETINGGEYVRVVFERPLDSSRDITVYPRIISGNPVVEVYEKDGDEIIASFDSLNDNEYNRVYLNDLIGEQDTFDLLVLNGDVEFDHIIDPIQEWFEECDSIDVEWTVDGWNAGGGTCTATNGASETMTRTTDLTGRTNAYLNFSWEVNKIDSGEFLTVYAGTSVATLQQVFQIQGDGGTQSGQQLVDISSYISSTTTVRAECNSRGGESCTWDSINLSTVTPLDEEYPKFTGFESTPSNNTSYSQGAIYRFNSTVMSTNGTVGFEFNGVNYTARNLSATIYNVTIPDLGAGTYSYYWWGYGNGTSKNFNFSAVSSYTVAKASGAVELYVNHTQENVSINSGESIYLNATLSSGDPSGRIILYKNETAINNGTSPVFNDTLFSVAGLYNISAFFQGSQNYTSNWSNILYVNVTQSLNTAPQIVSVDSIPSIDPLESGERKITFNFTAYDADGAGDLNSSSVTSLFNRTGETTRSNNTCVLSQIFDTNFANYTCTIGLWYFDGAGSWSINVSIKDNQTELAVNDTESFVYNSLTAMVMSPSSLTWPSVAVTDTDILSDNGPILINNTGNDPISNGDLRITAVDLFGETTPSDAIYAGNFTAHTSNSCNVGTFLVNGTATGVVGATLPVGNHSINDGSTGQEQLYLCLEALNPGITSQPYSTAQGGAWTIAVFTSLFISALGISGKRKKPKKNKITEDNLLEIVEDKIREKYGIGIKELFEEKSDKRLIGIPVDIFKDGLSPAESVCKYLKENKKLKFSEISALIGRDQRTVWINYRNAVKKNTKIIQISKKSFDIPISVLSNRSMSILENVVCYLKEKGFTNSKISSLLSKDARNVWTLYSRARKKLVK